MGRIRLSWSIAVVLAGVAASPVPAVVMNTVETYDATSNANVVDNTAPGSSLTLSQFQSSLSAARPLNLGGVANFELASYVPAADPAITNTFDFRLGAAGATNVRVTSNITIDPVTSVNPSTGTITPISGSGVLANQTSGNDLTFTFGAVTDSGTGAVIPHVGVTEVGFTLLSRTAYPSGGRTFTITATFSDSTTLQISDQVGNGKATDDTFYSFKAPEYRFITSVFVDSSGTTSSTASTAVFDDFGIVVAPEPVSTAWLAGAALLLTVRRPTRGRGH